MDETKIGMIRQSTFEDVLKTEYSEEFDNLRKKAMVTSFFKYGALKDNYSIHKTINAIESLVLRLELYKKTGNRELLIDVANFAMNEFMYPQHPNAHYEATDSNYCVISGMGVRQISMFKEDNNE